MKRIVHLLLNIKLKYFKNHCYGHTERKHTKTQKRAHGSRLVGVNELACKEENQKQREQYALNRFFEHGKLAQHIAVMHAQKRYKSGNRCIQFYAKQHKIGNEQIFVIHFP